VRFFSARNVSPRAANTLLREGRTASGEDVFRIPNRLRRPVKKAERSGADARPNTGKIQVRLQGEKALLIHLKYLNSLDIFERKNFAAKFHRLLRITL
jgi:hypothetical protein